MRLGLAESAERQEMASEDRLSMHAELQDRAARAAKREEDERERVKLEQKRKEKQRLRDVRFGASVSSQALADCVYILQALLTGLSVETISLIEKRKARELAEQRKATQDAQERVEREKLERVRNEEEERVRQQAEAIIFGRIEAIAQEQRQGKLERLRKRSQGWIWPTEILQTNGESSWQRRSTTEVQHLQLGSASQEAMPSWWRP